MLMLSNYCLMIKPNITIDCAGLRCCSRAGESQIPKSHACLLAESRKSNAPVLRAKAMVEAQWGWDEFVIIKF
jgi:hypothetical protein